MSKTERKIQSAFGKDKELQEARKDLVELKKSDHEAGEKDPDYDGEYAYHQINRIEEFVFAQEASIAAMVRASESGDNPEEYMPTDNPFSGTYEL